MILFKFLRFPLNDCGYYEKYSSFSIDSNLYDRVEEINILYLEEGEMNADIGIVSYQKVNGLFL